MGKEMLVEDAKLLPHFIPNEYHKYIPDKCTCGSPIAISSTRKVMRCTNPKCPRKSAYRMADMLTEFGIKGLGASLCSRLLLENKEWKSHLSIWTLKESNFPFSMPYEVLADTQRQLNYIKSQPITVKEFMSKLCLPNLKQNALKIFNGIDDLHSLFATLKTPEDLHEFVADGLGSDGDLASDITQTLIYFWKDLMLIYKEFNFVPDVKSEYKIAITGEIWREQEMSRDSFSAYIKELSEGKVGVHVCKALASVDYVIADDVSRSRTYLAGKSRGVLITSKDFCDKIREGLEYDRQS